MRKETCSCTCTGITVCSTILCVYMYIPLQSAQGPAPPPKQFQQAAQGL